MTNSASKLLHLLFIVLLITAAPVMAGENDTPASITLKLPEIKLTDTLEEVKQFNLEEALAAVGMDEEAYYVVTQINQAIAGLQDLTADVEVVENRGERQEVVTLKLCASLAHKIVRMEFFQPSALKGQIYVADQKAMEVRMYMPVNNQIAVQRMEDLSGQAANALSITDLDLETLFDFSQYEVALVGAAEEGEVISYTLRLTGFEDQVQYVEVRSDTFVPHKVLVYEDEALLGSLTFTNVVLDQDLSAETLVRLPAAKEVRL